MKRFFERIRRKALDPKEPPVLIVAFGDSNTQGVQEKGRLDPAGVYHRRLQERLEAFHPATTFSTINAGVDGTTAIRALERLERDVLSHRPDLVLVAFGTNDCLGGFEKLGEFESALDQMVGEIGTRTEADIVLLTPPFLASRKNSQIHPDHLPAAERIIRAQVDGSLASYVEAIRRVAAKDGLPLADVHAGWQRLVNEGISVDDWLCNGLNHPDSRGHDLAATIVFSVFDSIFSEKIDLCQNNIGED